MFPKSSGADRGQERCRHWLRGPTRAVTYCWRQCSGCPHGTCNWGEKLARETGEQVRELLNTLRDAAAETDRQQARRRKLERMLFGISSESKRSQVNQDTVAGRGGGDTAAEGQDEEGAEGQGAAGQKKDGAGQKNKSKGSKRGRPAGSRSYTRTDPSELDESEEVLLPAAKLCKCEDCGKPFRPNGYRETELIEVEVKGHKRIIRRATMRRGCPCTERQEAVVPPVPRMLPGTPYGLSTYDVQLSGAPARRTDSHPALLGPLAPKIP